MSEPNDESRGVPATMQVWAGTPAVIWHGRIKDGKDDLTPDEWRDAALAFDAVWGQPCGSCHPCSNWTGEVMRRGVQLVRDAMAHGGADIDGMLEDLLNDPHEAVSVWAWNRAQSPT